VVAAGAEPFREAGEKIESAFDTGEEEELQRKLQETQGLAAQASRLERENARLRELLKGKRSFYEYGPLARVVAPVGNQFTNRIQIDVGTEDGIKPQMPVVVGENTLVGRTTEHVSRSTAQVMLITDREFHAGVRIIPPAEFDPASGRLGPAATAKGSSGLTWRATSGSSTWTIAPGPRRATTSSPAAGRGAGSSCSLRGCSWGP
jgi:rod shape-determining protein MreC